LETAALPDNVVRTIGKFQRCTPVDELHMTFQVPYIYDYVMKSCRQQAEVTQNHENGNVSDIGKGEARNRKRKRLKLAAVMHTTDHMTRQPL
jgi:hypothetical protein